MLNLSMSTANGHTTFTIKSNSQTAGTAPPPVTHTTYHWAVYNETSGLDVGMPFNTMDDHTAATVFNMAITSTNGNAALSTDAGDTVPPQTYDVLTDNHVLIKPDLSKFQPTDLLPLDGVALDASLLPTIGIEYENGSGTISSAGIRLESQTTV